MFVDCSGSSLLDCVEHSDGEDIHGRPLTFTVLPFPSTVLETPVIDRDFRIRYGSAPVVMLLLEFSLKGNPYKKLE